MLIAVDCGRDGIKSIYYNENCKSKNLNDKLERKRFDAKYANVDFRYLKYSPTLNWIKDDDIIAAINKGRPIAYGESCDKLFPPEEIQYATVDEVYLEHSINYTLISVARFVKDENEEIIVGLDLTADNIHKEEEIRNILKKKWTVDFYNTAGKIVSTKKFEIVKVGIWYQEWVSLMDSCIDNKFDIIKEKVKLQYLIVGTGRKTTNTLLINQLGILKNYAYEVGTEKFYKYVKEQLYRQYNIKKTTLEIEDIIQHNKSINKNGVNIDLSYLVQDALVKILENLKNKIMEDFGDYTPDKILYTGGGTYLFGETMKKLFSTLEVIEDPVFSNARGIIKLLMRKFVWNKKGL